MLFCFFSVFVSTSRSDLNCFRSLSRISADSNHSSSAKSCPRLFGIFHHLTRFKEDGTERGDKQRAQYPLSAGRLDKNSTTQLVFWPASAEEEEEEEGATTTATEEEVTVPATTTEEMATEEEATVPATTTEETAREEEEEEATGPATTTATAASGTTEEEEDFLSRLNE